MHCHRNLGHEIGHAVQNARGTTDRTRNPLTGVRRSEEFAVGAETLLERMCQHLNPELNTAGWKWSRLTHVKMKEVEGVCKSLFSVDGIINFGNHHGHGFVHRK